MPLTITFITTISYILSGCHTAQIIIAAVTVSWTAATTTYSPGYKDIDNKRRSRKLYIMDCWSLLGAEKTIMSLFPFRTLCATIVDIARRLSRGSEEWRALLVAAAIAAPRMIPAQSLQATLTSTPKVNNCSPDSERYNTRSYGEKGPFHSLVCCLYYPSPTLYTLRRVLSLSAARSRERKIRASLKRTWPRSGENTLRWKRVTGLRARRMPRSLQAVRTRCPRLVAAVQNLATRHMRRVQSAR